MAAQEPLGDRARAAENEQEGEGKEGLEKCCGELRVRRPQHSPDSNQGDLAVNQQQDRAAPLADIPGTASSGAGLSPYLQKAGQGQGCWVPGAGTGHWRHLRLCQLSDASV